MAVSLPTHSIGDRRRAPLVFALGALVVVLGLAATQIGVMIASVALRTHHYGYGGIGIASALATPITGIVAWRSSRTRPTRLSQALVIETAMLIAALAVLVAWALFVLYLLAVLRQGLEHAHFSK
jgi:hypothetical protein